MHRSVPFLTFVGVSLLATSVGATEPDSYGRDMFNPSPEGSDESPVVDFGLEYRPRAESSPLGPIRWVPGAPNTSYSHRARLMGVFAHNLLRAKLSLQNVYVASPPEELAPVEALEAYVQFGSPELRTRLGRQEITFGTGRILTGPFWSQRGRPIDAARVRYQNDSFAADGFIGRHNGSGLYRDMAGAYVEGDIGPVRTAVTALLETNRFLRENQRRGLEEGYTRFTGGFDFELSSPFFVSGETLVQVGSWEGDATLIGGPPNDPTRLEIQSGDIRAWFAGLSVGYALGDWVMPVLFAEYLSGDRDLSDDRIGVFDTVLGYRRRFYGRIDRFIRMPRDTRNGGLIDTGLRTKSDLWKGTLFTEWHYFQVPQVDLDGRNGPAGAELDVRYVYPVTDHMNLEVASMVFSHLGDFRDLPGTDEPRNVRVKHYAYVQLDLQI